MKLSFDQYGNIPTEGICVDQSLQEIPTYKTEESCTASGNYQWITKLKNSTLEEALVGQLNLFFSTKRGRYIYNKKFGITSDYVFGKLYIESVDLDTFSRKLKEALRSSDLMTDAAVFVYQPDEQSLQIVINNEEVVVTWKYTITDGRLVKIEQVENKETEYNYITAKGYLKASDSTQYKVDFIFEKCNIKNSISLDSDIFYAYRVQAVTTNRSTSGMLITDYTINDFDQTLNLKEPVTSFNWILVEIWPAAKANLEVATNPYLVGE